jgi:uncharacterized coiled-coil protein SlyX
MTTPGVDALLEIRLLVQTDRDAMISTELTSLIPAIELMTDHLKFIDEKLAELTKKN